MTEDIEKRPYENEHACRLKNPDDFKAGSFRRTTRKHDGKEYSVIMGKLKGEDAMTEQAYRYKKNVWTAVQARKHCNDHDGSFEAAKSSKSEDTDIERRILSFDNTELRIDDKKPMIVGYAAKTGVFTDLGWFREKIKSGAFSDVLEDDIRCLKNHDPNLIIGRTTNKTLRLKENTVGLRFENDMPETTTGKDTREEIRSKLITGCSFSFTIPEGGDEWKRFDDGKKPERTIVKLEKLYDVGPVTFPAYPDTTVAARSLEKFKNETIEQVEEKDGEQETAKEKDEEENNNKEESAKTYTCECIECGHIEETKEHCKDIKCPECGGDMRRKERPGPGRSEEKEEHENLVDDERMRDIRRKARKAQRIINRNRPAQD